MKPTKQTVYLPVKVENNKEDFTSATFYITEPSDDGEKITHFLKEKEGYFFTPEQLNEYTTNIIKQALETAAENAEVKVTENALIEDGSCYTTYDDGVISVTSDKQSIINTFEETFKKFSVE